MVDIHFDMSEQDADALLEITNADGKGNEMDSSDKFEHVTFSLSVSGAFAYKRAVCTFSLLKSLRARTILM